MATLMLGLDPGEKNFGYSVVLYDEQYHRIEVMEVGIIPHTIPKIENDLMASCRPFIRAFRRLLKRLNPKELVIERFINRGRIGAALTEKTNILIGMAVALANRMHIAVTCFTSAVWKNDVNPVMQITDLYKRVSKTIRDYNKAHTKRSHVVVKRVKKKHSKKKLVKESKLNWSADKLKQMLSMVPHVTDSTLLNIKAIIERQPRQEKRRVKITLLNLSQLADSISGAIIKKGLEEP